MLPEQRRKFEEVAAEMHRLDPGLPKDLVKHMKAKWADRRPDDPYVYATRELEEIADRKVSEDIKAGVSYSWSSNCYRDAAGRLRRKQALPATPAPPVAPAQAKKVSELTVSEYNELLRKNSAFGQLGDSLEWFFNLAVKIVGCLFLAALVGFALLWLFAR